VGRGAWPISPLSSRLSRLAVGSPWKQPTRDDGPERFPASESYGVVSSTTSACDGACSVIV
jgi:hypothetical protein